MDKGKRDGKRAAEMSKLCNEVWSAAKEGGADPAENSRLALAITKAKDANVPKTNIERAMARAADSADGMEEVLYEVYAPAGVGLLVYANTDSRNRTVREIKGVIKNSVSEHCSNHRHCLSATTVSLSEPQKLLPHTLLRFAS